MVDEKTLIISTCDAEQCFTLNKDYLNEDSIKMTCSDSNDARKDIDMLLDRKEAEQLIDGIEYMFKLRKYANLKNE